MIHQNNVQTLVKLQKMIKKGTVPIFDIDGVLLDATHRQVNNPDGSLNLSAYLENNTPDNIKKDTALPMTMLAAWCTYKRIKYAVATARVFCKDTETHLRGLGVRPDIVISRRDNGDRRPDHVLKHDGLLAHFTESERKRLLLIDDNFDNCKAAIQTGARAMLIAFDGH